MLVFFAVISLIFLGILSLAYVGGPGPMTAVYGFFGVMILFTLFPPLIVLWIFIYIIAISCKASNVRWRNYMLVHAAIVLLLNCVGWYPVLQRIPEMRELKATYQPQPITSLLAYETEKDDADARGTSADGSANPGNEFLKQTEEEIYLSQAGGKLKYRSHGLRTLMSLHQGTVSEFRVANGFGSVRMGDVRPRKEYIDLPPLEPIPQPEWTPLPYDPNASPQRELVYADDGEVGPDTTNRGSKRDILSFHVDQVVNFANAAGFGYVDRQRRQMIGFQSHGFRSSPQWGGDERSSNLSYQVARLELVSLLKHTPPAVYLSDNLPSMDELKADATPTRELDEFERHAIDRLRGGEDLVVVEDQLSVRMVGAIRAVDECLQCHQGREGKLLGGFSYRLTPAASKSPPKTVPDGKQTVPEKQKPLT